jgi:ParB family chromosome partitioning protein
VEEIVRALQGANNEPEGLSKLKPKNETLEVLKSELNNQLKTKVDIQYNEQGKGKIILTFNSSDDLDYLVGLLKK